MQVSFQGNEKMLKNGLNNACEKKLICDKILAYPNFEIVLYCIQILLFVSLGLFWR